MTSLSFRMLSDRKLVSIVSGQSPASTTYNDAGVGLPFFQGKQDFGRTHPTARIWCDEGRTFANAGDILLSVRAPVGDVNMADQTCAIGRGITGLRPGEGIDPWFLFYALQFVKPVLEGRATGSTFGSINKATILDLEIPFPEPTVQIAIAQMLRLASSVIEHEESLTLRSLELKRTALQRLFTRGLRGEEQKESEIGPIPESWRVITLGDLGRIGNGSTPKRGHTAYWDGGHYPWLTSAKVYDREIYLADQFVTQTALEECHLPRVRPGSVLVAITGQGKTLGHCAVLRIEATVNQHIAYVSIEDQDAAKPSFVRGFLETQYEFLRQVGSGGGSTKGALTCSFLRAMKMPMPADDSNGREEQGEIVEILDAIDKKIEIQTKKRALLETLFKSLLHKLMTGEVSVDDLDLSAMDVGLGEPYRAHDGHPTSTV